MNKIETIKKIISAVMIIAMVLMIGTIIRVSWYSVLVSDDFWYAADAGVKDLSLWENFINSLKYTGWVYMTHQGTYFSEFFGVFFTPVTHGGFRALRFWMVLNSVLLYSSMLWFLNVFIDGVAKCETYIKLTIMACVVFAMSQYEAFQEIFYWWVGASVYTFPFSLFIISATTFLLANRGKNVKRWVIISCITGFCAVGGSLAITAITCYFLFVMVIYYAVRDHRFSRINLLIFGVAFAGALINGIAPGNYIRQSSEGELNLIKSIGDAFSTYFSNIRWLFAYDERTNFLAIFILMVICGFLIGQNFKADKKAWLVASIFMIAAPMSVIFPVVTGYNVPWLPNRCLFVALFAFVAMSLNFALMLGALIKSFIIPEKTGPVLLMLIILCFFAHITSGFSIMNTVGTRTNDQLARHEIQDHYAFVRGTIEGFPEHQGEDYVMDIGTSPEEIENYYCFFLPTGTESRINQAICWAYGLNTITTSREE